mmetsp:Transcript_1567/g.2985  ORF Transcript_1567/g.2985 Transcript_1567/m.2985 type:complete len:237 (-) Transcript_1567:92-802(-)
MRSNMSWALWSFSSASFSSLARTRIMLPRTRACIFTTAFNCLSESDDGSGSAFSFLTSVANLSKTTSVSCSSAGFPAVDTGWRIWFSVSCISASHPLAAHKNNSHSEQYTTAAQSSHTPQTFGGAEGSFIVWSSILIFAMLPCEFSWVCNSPYVRIFSVCSIAPTSTFDVLPCCSSVCNSLGSSRWSSPRDRSSRFIDGSCSSGGVAGSLVGFTSSTSERSSKPSISRSNDKSSIF